MYLGVSQKFLLSATLALVVGLLLSPVAGLAATDYVEGEVIVTFKPAATETVAKSALSRKSLKFSQRFGWLSEKRGRQTGLVRHKGKKTAELIAELKDDPTVESVEPNYLRWLNAEPNDTRFGELWGLKNTGQLVDGTRGTSGADVKFVEAWDMARVTPTEIVVGVIDTGVDYTHPDLQANMWRNSGEVLNNGIDDDNNGYIDDIHGYDFSDDDGDPSDADSHGTHVSGTVAAVGNNNSGVVGINHRAKIMGLKVSTNGDSISTSAVIEAIQYATTMKGRGVNIVALNASFGGGGFSNSERSAIIAAGNAGIIFCAAAGNDSANNDVINTYPASYRLASMIVVAATDSKDALATFSNYGATDVDLAAPGVSILSAQPADVALKVGNTNYDSTAMTYTGTTPGLSGKIYYCGIGNPTDFPAAVQGNIALIERGTLTFAEKVTNAIAAGATAVIVYNNVTGSFLGTLGGPGDWIPARSISREAGVAIKAVAPANASLTLTSGFQFMEGTSMATPHVTGAVSFAAMNFPTETVAQRIARILDNVDAKSGLSGKVVTGGRLNLRRTVDVDNDSIADWMEPSGANPPTITTSTPLPGGAVSSAYSQSVAATGGKVPYTWSVISGVLPAGLTLSSAGAITGTPTTPGSFNFVLQVRDSLSATSARSVTLSIAATALSITSPATLPAGTVGSTYSGSLSAIGGTPTYGWSILSGALPTGVSLSSAGTFTGTPAAPGTFTFDAQVTDGGLASVSKTFSITIDPLPLNITTASSLPVGALTLPYSQNLIVTGGTAPHVWTLNAGALPAGLTLGSQGDIAGTPSAFGTFNFTALVTDSVSRTLTKDFVILIEEHPITVATASSLLAGVKTLAYTKAFAAVGGSGAFTWARTGGSLPAGMKLSNAGVLSGTPTQAGLFNFTLTVTDSLGLKASQGFQLEIHATYLRPVLNPVSFETTTVGMPFSYPVTATNYPKLFTITKLPPGITYSTTTGVMSGRPTTPGTYEILIKATNPAGPSETIMAPLVVNALPATFIGSFTGVIARDPTVNNNLGGRLTLTTTKVGGYTAKVTVGATAKFITGYLSDTAPQVRVTLGNGLLSLTLDENLQRVTGTHGGASLSGWRSTWSAARPAGSRVGYYTFAIDLADGADDGVSDIPQGSGYASFTVTASGALTVTGKVADGTTFTSAGFIGPEGEIAVYSSLYANLGSLAGVLTLAEDPNLTFLGNTVSGPLTWFKPATKARNYRTGFGPLNLNAFGKYLSSSASKGIVAGLPATGAVRLLFTDGGLAASVTDPNVAALGYTAAKTIVMPKFGADNPAKATLNLNKASGLVGGSFTLTDPSPVPPRRVTFQGMVVRPASGNSKAVGYFLLPQIPATGQTINTSPLLSGKVMIEQAPADE